MNIFFTVLFFGLVVISTSVIGKEETPERTLGLTNYEPNLIGYSYDQDDKEAFLDFKLSFEYPLAHGPLSKLTKMSLYPSFLIKACDNDFLNSCYPFFSFTGRFGQYIGVRDSSPVISKRFNPKLFVRFDIKNADYLDIEYGHESNGQRVMTQLSYDSLAADLDKLEHANDYISRGWDFYGFTYKRTFSGGPHESDRTKNVVTGYLKIKKYIGGLLQGDIEEYFDWEDRRSITAREQVSGLSILAKIKNNNEPLFLGINKVALIYETGTSSPTKYNTLILEATTNTFGVPIMFWGRWGYNSDLAQYYKKVNSVGVAFELVTCGPGEC